MDWGADRGVLMKLYCSFVHFRLEYGIYFFCDLINSSVYIYISTYLFPLWVRGSRIGPTCPPACPKRRLNGGVNITV